MTTMNANVTRYESLQRNGLAAIMPIAMAAAVLACCETSRAAVLINELMAATSEQRLSWDARGVPRLGSGAQWMELSFNSAGWTSTSLPAGYGFTGLASDRKST